MDPFSVVNSPSMWAVLFVSLVVFFYKWSTKNFDYFVSQGIPGPKPIPIFGNVWGLWKRNVVEYDFKLFEQYGKTVGIFDGTTPNLLTADADLIRSVMVKDFDHFVNRRDMTITAKYARKMVNIMQDQDWKDVRNCLTPTFTTGKIKKMAPLIVDCSNDMSRKLIDKCRANGSIDSKTIFSNFTMDVIAKCAFGLTIDNLDKEDDEFMKRAKRVFNPSANKSPIILLGFIDIGALKDKMLNYIFIKQFQFFFQILENIVNERKHAKEEFNDFIEITREAVSGVSKEINGTKVAVFGEEDVAEIIIAQSVIFLLAGSDTTSTTLTNSSFVLARHPEIQEKLYEQIMEKLEQHGEVCHEMVLDFPYLDQFIHEVLRMYPVLPRLERQCNKTVSYDGLTIKKGTLVSIATFPLHYSEEYYDEPEKFNPDRWAPENKDNLNPYAYAPFGLGPRNCIGTRFAMEELKIALCTVLSRVKFVPVEETPEKLEWDTGMASIVQAVSVVVGAEQR